MELTLCTLTIKFKEGSSCICKHTIHTYIHTYEDTFCSIFISILFFVTVAHSYSYTDERLPFISNQ